MGEGCDTERRKQGGQVSVTSNAIPGVRCGKCLGRITQEENEVSRRLQAKHKPGENFSPPRVCAACIIETIMSWPDDEGATDKGAK